MEWREIADCLGRSPSTVHALGKEGLRRIEAYFRKVGLAALAPPLRSLGNSLPTSVSATSGAYLGAGTTRWVSACAVALATMAGLWLLFAVEASGQRPELRALAGGGPPGNSAGWDGADSNPVQLGDEPRAAVDIPNHPMVFGRVVRESDGRPISGVEVAVFDFVEQETPRETSDERGYFAFSRTADAKGPFHLVARVAQEPGKEVLGHRVVPAVRASMEPLIVALPPSCLLTGKVVSKVTGSAIKDFVITVYDHPGTPIPTVGIGREEHMTPRHSPHVYWPAPLYPCSLWASLDPNLGKLAELEVSSGAGDFSLEGLGPGLFMLCVRAPGYRVETVRDVSLAVGKPFELAVELLRTSGSKDVFVDAGSNDPISGLPVRQDEDELFGLVCETTDASGRAPGLEYARALGGSGYGSGTGALALGPASAHRGNLSRLDLRAGLPVVLEDLWGDSEQSPRLFANTRTKPGGEWSIDGLSLSELESERPKLLVLDPTCTKVVACQHDALRHPGVPSGLSSSIQVECRWGDEPIRGVDVELIRLGADASGFSVTVCTGLDGRCAWAELNQGYYRVIVRHSMDREDLEHGGSNDFAWQFAEHQYEVVLAASEDRDIFIDLGARSSLPIVPSQFASYELSHVEAVVRSVAGHGHEVRFATPIREGCYIDCPVEAPGAYEIRRLIGDRAGILLRDVTFRILPGGGFEGPLLEIGVDDSRFTLEVLARDSRTDEPILDAFAGLGSGISEWRTLYGRLRTELGDQAPLELRRRMKRFGSVLVEPVDGVIRLAGLPCRDFPVIVGSPQHAYREVQVAIQAGSTATRIDVDLVRSESVVVGNTFIGLANPGGVYRVPGPRDLRQGDVILEASGHEVRSWGDLQRVLLESRDYAATSLRIEREGVSMQVRVDREGSIGSSDYMADWLTNRAF